MFRLTSARMFFVYSLLMLVPTSGSTLRAEPPVPRTVVWDSAHMVGLKAEVDAPSQPVERALARVRAAASDAKRLGTLTVTDSGAVASSNDIHDYVSYSRYWWPNPDTEDGLPYVRKDGNVNRELVARGDRESLGTLTDSVQALSLAYYFFDDEEAGRKAAELIKTWFLDPDTLMNPNLNFGQAVPGKAEGRGAGIIDTRGFILVLDALALLDPSVGWSQTEDEKLQQWFREYGKWLKTSDLGKHELVAKNNHGSWYDAQVARYALYAGDFASAKETIAAAKQRRIESQFQADGMQPEENKRTLSLHYSMFNLSALGILARIGEHPDVGVDLWTYAPPNGCGFECALRALVPYIAKEKEWEHQQISPFGISRAEHMMLRFASCRFADSAFQDLPKAASIRHSQYDFTQLLAPKYAGSRGK